MKQFFLCYLKFLIVVLIFLDTMQYRVSISIGTVQLTITDISLLMLYIIWWVMVIRGEVVFPSFYDHYRLYLLIFFFLLPIPIGFLNGHLVESILKEARTPFYFVLLFVLVTVQLDRDELSAVVKWLLVVSSLALVVGFIAYTFNIQVASSLKEREFLSGIDTRKFGYHSSHLAIIFSSLILLNFSMVSERFSFKSFTAFMLFPVFAIGVTLTYIRSFFIGLCMGICLSWIFHPVMKKLSMALLSVMWGMVILLFVMTLSPNVTQAVLKIPAIERVMSIFDASMSTRSSSQTASGRFEAFSSSLELAAKKPLLGFGYGVRSRSKLSHYTVDRLEAHGTLYHSSPSWFIVRTGFIGFVLFTIIFTSFAFRLARFYLTLDDPPLIRAYMLSSVSLIGAGFMISMGCNVMYGAPHFTPFLMLITGLALAHTYDDNEPLDRAVPDRLVYESIE